MDKKEQIILAAMKLLVENGVQATPMSAIAKEANTGMGTVYNYFPAKEDLINAIYRYIKEDEMKTVGALYVNESIKKQFEHFYKTMIQYMVANPMHFWFMEQFSVSPIIKEDTRQEGIKTFIGFSDTLRRGQVQGIIKSIDIDELILFVHAGFRGFIRWLLMTGKPLTQHMLDNQLRISWDCIKE